MHRHGSSLPVLTTFRALVFCSHPLLGKAPPLSFRVWASRGCQIALVCILVAKLAQEFSDETNNSLHTSSGPKEVGTKGLS